MKSMFVDKKLLRKVLLSWVFCCCVFSIFNLSYSSFAAGNQEKYLIGEGDKLDISVWNNEELKKEVFVRPDGWISYPLAGEIFAAGLYPEVLASQIRQKLTKFLKNPQVSVIVLEYKSKKILVLGEVKKPGLYQFEGGMTAFDSIGVAGGYEKHAKLKNILVVRNGNSAHPEFHLADLYRLVHDGDRTKDLGLEPGDIVYVPKTFIGDIGDCLDFFMSRIKPAADTYALYSIAQK